MPGNLLIKTHDIDVDPIGFKVFGSGQKKISRVRQDNFLLTRANFKNFGSNSAIKPNYNLIITRSTSSIMCQVLIQSSEKNIFVFTKDPLDSHITRQALHPWMCCSRGAHPLPSFTFKYTYLFYEFYSAVMTGFDLAEGSHRMTYVRTYQRYVFFYSNQKQI